MVDEGRVRSPEPERARPARDGSVTLGLIPAPEILDVCQERARREGWDLAVCLTDLPVYRSGRLVVADASAGPG